MDKNEIEIRKLRQDLDRLNSKLRQPVRPHRTQNKDWDHKELNVDDLKITDLKGSGPITITDTATDKDYFVKVINGRVVKFEGVRL